MAAHAFSRACALVALASIALPLAAGLTACRGPRGPITPETVASPDSEVVIDPGLRNHIALPSTRSPVRTLTADGRMAFSFHLQNQTSERLAIHYESIFYDEAGVPVDRYVQTAFLSPFEVLPITIASASPRATSVQVQVRPAN